MEKNDEDFQLLQSLQKRIKAFSCTKVLRAVFALLPALLRDTDFPNKLNSDPELLSVKNGVLNLRTKELRERQQDDYLTYELPFEYHAEHAEKDIVRDLFKQLTLSDRLGRPEYLEYLLSLLGYTITGYSTLEVIVFLIGDGANGKGIVELLMQTTFTCELFYAAPDDIIKGGKFSATPGTACSYLAKLKGKRIAWVDECPEGRLNQSLFRTLSGGAKINARELHQKQGDGFEPTHQIFINSNHNPGLDVDPHMMRRLIALVFEACFRYADDPDLEMRYDAENPKHFERDDTFKTRIQKGYLCTGFLSLLVDYASKFLITGKIPEKPECCVIKAKEVQLENDKLAQFIDDKCSTGKDEKVMCTDFLTRYNAFRKPRAPLRKKEMHEQMERKGFKRVKWAGRQQEFFQKTVYVGVAFDMEDEFIWNSY
jgi:putative DNA primase/helicase